MQTETVTEICKNARAAARVLARAQTSTKNAALLAIADELTQRQDEVLAANARDVAAGVEAGLSEALIDRLTLTAERITAMAADVRTVAELDDPAGEILEEWTAPSGIEIRKVRVPLGVVAVVYEARPNVTIDSAVLCLKAGNAVVLRGSSSAAHSNAVLAQIARAGVVHAGLPEAAVSFLGSGSRDELAELATQDRYVDLIIPRGGEGLKNALKGVATVPVIYAASGNCHVYVDADADLEMARRITLNSKTQRPGVCNAAESLLVHSAVAQEFLPQALADLDEAGVELRTDGRAKALSPQLAGKLKDATEEDFATEFLALIMSVKVVDSIEEAINHVNQYGSGHSEAIITSNPAAAEQFESAVDAACVYVNASTRFTDGSEFGMGAEIGNSTQKLHARGPIALRELCTFKYIVHGQGQVRT